jgi:hypothetical protein
MLSRRSAVKLAAVIVIILIGVAYWYYADYRSSPIQEVEKTVEMQK